ncbi:Rrf2 family transcriptional regulator [Rhizobium leguminosarum]|uniref:RrF2 family transcriptional regulator n=1 Tax=Rhizobium leguminosarum TaxID=384 RepID=UPI001C94437A|nr:Rrf2 family transcriptional regulator [Rhizobium leguminosarum]MBY5779407.1 Rrf2 family transcriptional regulator [Rhizobium leguminosarum]
MRLTRYTDYAIRVLIFLGAREGEICSIRSIATTFSISQNHLMKVVQDLAAAGFIDSVRGRNGGIRLPREASAINLGTLLRHTEGLTDLLDCPACMVRSGCGMPSILTEATAAFVGVFEKYTVADLVRRRELLRSLLAAA